jgi:signal peptidase I
MHHQTVRRVIAMGGDEVSVGDDGRVTLNGEALDEPYATYCTPDAQSIDEVIPGGALENPFAQSDAPAQAQAVPTGGAEGIDDMDYPLTVPEGAVFVLCDNRDNRLDSRSSRFGLVAEADIKGMARAIIWPVFRAGLLDIGPAVK